MTNNVIILMLSVSILLGLFSLIGFLWGLRHNQFDDEEKSTNSVQYDGVDELNDAVKRDEKRQKMKEAREARQKNYGANLD